MNGVVIRDAQQADKKELLELLDELGEELNRAAGFNPRNAEASKVGGKMMDELLQKDDTKIYVAELGKKLVGAVIFYLRPNARHGYYQVHIGDMVVSESSRRKGIGTRLMEAVKDYCRNNNIKVIKLDSGLELEDAHRFYEKNGGKFTEKMFRFDL